MKSKIIFNTDICRDINSLLALLFILKADCELLGIVTTGKDPELKSRFCKKLLSSMGREIPVFYGFEHTHEQGNIRLSELDYHFLSSRELGMSDREAGVSRDGIKFLIDTAKKFPGEVDFISTAPVTNFAMAMQSDLNFADRAGSIIIIAGQTPELRDSDLVEPDYNIKSDFGAMKTLLLSRAKIKIISRSESPVLRRDMKLSTDENSKFPNDFYLRHFELINEKTVPLADPVAVASVLYPDEFSFLPVEPVFHFPRRLKIFESESSNIKWANEISAAVYEKIFSSIFCS